MAAKDNAFLVDTRPTKTVVVSSLTRDASVQASVLDLIDNSIDAARDNIFEGIDSDEAPVIPSSYDGFEIALEFSGQEFTISDNCGGISKDNLATMVLRFGETSAHELGIGVFGVGLNRALFKLGAKSVLQTDTGSVRAELELNVPEYLASDDWNLPAVETTSTGVPGTDITITELPAAISKDFADSDWLDDLRKEIGIRYGQFIAKGLVIKLDGKPVETHITKIRENGPFGGEYKVFKVGEGVSVHLEFGQLNDHRFTNEVGYDKARNKEIVKEFGWTVICNDRVILMSDTSLKTGWETGFHTEFYGFAGIARFVSSNPSNLPWNTTKTDVDMNNPAYQLALIDMRKLAEKWRTKSQQRKRESAKGVVVGELPPLTPKTTTPKPTPASTKKTKSKTTAKATKKAPTIKQDHHACRSILPDDINELHCSDKLLALVHEAKRVDIYQDPYMSLALLRMLFETTGMEYCRRHGKADEIRDFAVAGRLKKGHKMTDKQKEQATPSMDELLAFLLSDASVWGATKSALKHSLNQMKKHQKPLNGVLHNPFQQVGYHFAETIRNDVTPILRHLLES